MKERERCIIAYNTYLGSGVKTSLVSAIFGSRSKNTEPKTLYKKVNLGWDAETRQIELFPLTQRKRSIDFNAESKCHNPELHASGHSREVPAKHCSCGFYAYKDNDDAKNHDQHGNFLVKVVASGRMLEHEKGYRYGHQRVEEIVVGNCFLCSVPADRVIIFCHTGYSRTLFKDSIIPACSEHIIHSAPNRSISFDQVGELASHSLPTHAPRIHCYSSSPLVQPWVSDIDIDTIGKEPVLSFKDKTRETFREYSSLVYYAAATAGVGVILSAEKWLFI